MFKAYDIRTQVKLLDDTLSRRLILSVGRYFKEVLHVRTVVLGRDARLGAPHLMQLTLDLFPPWGSKCWSIRCRNPLLFYFSCMQHPGAAAVMFTASHIPVSISA